MTDKINPDHYKSHPSGIECIEVTRHMSFNCGNAIKYIWRNGLKDGSPSVEDLRKAVWYLNDEILQIELQDSSQDSISAPKNVSSIDGGAGGHETLYRQRSRSQNN